MRASLYFRIAAILIALFAVGHTMGFRQTDPGWGLDSTIASMKTIRFVAQGFNRSYWDFFVGFGLFVSLLLILAAVVAWQMGSLPAPTLASMRIVVWALTVCFGLVTLLSWRYFFLAPVVFSLLIFICLLAGTLTLERNLCVDGYSVGQGY